MDNISPFNYSAFHPDSYPTSSNESVGDNGSTKHGPSLVSFGLPSDSAAAQYPRGGCSYSPVEAPVSQEPIHGTYWAGSGLGEGPSDLLRLHAPIPVPGCTPILRSDSCYPEDCAVSESRPAIHCLPVQHSTDFQPEYPQMQGYGYPGVSYLPTLDVTVPQLTFPTPSELLVGHYTQGNHSQQTPHSAFRQECYSSARAINKSHRPPSLLSARNVIEPDPDASFLGHSPSDTTPDSITSHEKKRHYLECLEHYVGFLHDHFRDNGIKPPPLERISSYRCLNSRSIRSLLIHMEKTTKQMKEQIFREEQKFLRLRQALQQQDGTMEGVQNGIDNLTLGK